jgi:hypothetical protein
MLYARGFEARFRRMTIEDAVLALGPDGHPVPF